MRFLCMLLSLVLGAPAMGLTATVYTYVDDKGTVVMTDEIKNVPERFRGKVTIIEQEDPLPRESPVPESEAPDVVRPAPQPSASRTVVEERKSSWSQFFWKALPNEIIPGLTQYQSVLLICGFVTGSLLFAGLWFSRNPALQFALKWALTFVVAGTFYGIYFAELGTTLSVEGKEEEVSDPRTVLDKVRVKVKEIEERQQERIDAMENVRQQVETLEEGGRP